MCKEFLSNQIERELLQGDKDKSNHCKYYAYTFCKRYLLMQNHIPNGKMLEIGYALVPSERRKGYGTEAAKIIVDYLFLSKELVRSKPTQTLEM